MLPPPVFDPHLYRALLKVARAEIETSDLIPVERDDFSSRMADALLSLSRDGYISGLRADVLEQGDNEVASFVVKLTAAGMELLIGWSSRFTRSDR